MTDLRILLADDHAVVREGVKALVEAQPDLRVVGEAEDGETACRRALALQPDVVVMDVSMPPSRRHGGHGTASRFRPGRAGPGPHRA